MKLYDLPSSPQCMKVRAVAYELGVELELVTVNIFKGESHRFGFVALNPNGLVPVLVDGDFVLWESNAILTYLASLHASPALISSNVRERANVDRWLHWQSAHLGPAIARVAVERVIRPMTLQTRADPAAVALATSAFQVHCQVLEVSLRNKDYIASHLSVADFAVACILHSAKAVDLSLESFPRTKAWLRRMLGRDSVKRALAEAQRATSDMYCRTAT